MSVRFSPDVPVCPHVVFGELEHSGGDADVVLEASEVLVSNAPEENNSFRKLLDQLDADHKILRSVIQRLEVQCGCLTKMSFTKKQMEANPADVNVEICKDEQTDGLGDEAALIGKEVEIDCVANFISEGCSGSGSEGSTVYSSKEVCDVHCPFSRGDEDKMASTFSIYRKSITAAMDELTGDISHVGGCRGLARRLLKTHRWDVFINLVIMSNSFLMGLHLEMKMSKLSEEADRPWRVMEITYTCIFFVELIIRITADGVRYFALCTDEWHWNYLDLVVVVSSLLEEVLSVYKYHMGGAASTENTDLSSLFDLLRLLKVFRIARIVRFVKSLRTLVYSILCTLRSLFWAGLLMLLIIYVFAIILAHGYDVHRTQYGSVESMDKWWGSLITSMLTLFKSVAGGLSWHEAIDPLAHLHGVYTWVFLAYVAFFI